MNTQAVTSSECIEKIKSALDYVSPDERAVWLKVGMGIRSELGEAGFEFFDNWSRCGSSYNASDAKSVWKSFKSGGKVTIASLFYLAKDAGWSWDQPDVRLSAEAIEKWRAESRRKAEEAEAEKARLNAAAAKRAAAIWDAAEPASDDHPYLKRKGVRAHGLRVGRWEVIDRETGEVRLVHPKALLVPIKDRTGALWSLQAIFPMKVMGGRDKDYLADGLKVGHFHAIGKPAEQGGKKVFILCEGYATGASLQEATDHLVLVCFDTSGLLPVAVAIRERVPDAIILVAADNDLWTKRKDGTPYNPGVEAATKAARVVGGCLAVPQFASLDGQPSDFNDLHQHEGSAPVIEQVCAALKAGPVHADEGAAALEAQVEDSGDALAAEVSAQTPEPAAGQVPHRDTDGEAGDADVVQDNRYFRVLGYKRKTYFIYQYKKRQVLEYSSRELAQAANLIELAELNWWEMKFPARNGGIGRDAVVNAIIRTADSRGVYDDSYRRGRGAWWDRDRLVIHLGDRLNVDGRDVSLSEIKSDYVYEAGTRLADLGETPLSNADGARLLKIAGMFRWEQRVSADLLCGWVFLAPICGALKWRPHIWLTGSAGSGKTGIISDFARKLIPADVPIFGQGDSTEAGLRQELDSDARPILIDESESDDQKARARIENVIAMLRQSSSDSGAKTYRGTAGGKSLSFMVRSMAMLSSIGIAVKQQQDVERIAVLALRSKRDDNPQANSWAAIKAELNWIGADASISSRLFRRAIDMVPVIMAAIDRFTEAIANHEGFGTQRHGDQYGALLAGAWCLTHDRAPTKEEAVRTVAMHNWGDHQTKHGEEHEDLMATLLGCPVVLEGGLRASIGVLIARAAGRPVEDVRFREMAPETADSHISMYGMKVSFDHLRVHPSNKQLELLLSNTKFASGLHERMKRIKGADTCSGKTFRIGQTSKNGVHIPLSTVFAEPDENDFDPIPRQRQTGGSPRRASEVEEDSPI